MRGRKRLRKKKLYGTRKSRNKKKRALHKYGAVIWYGSPPRGAWMATQIFGPEIPSDCTIWYYVGP